MKSKTGFALLVFLSVFLARISCFPPPSYAEEPQPAHRETLRFRVRQLDFQDSATQRVHLQDIFDLAAIYAAEDNLKEAIAFYEKGLKINGWRWEEQLTLARLLYRAGSSKEAADRVNLVYLYAEDAPLIGEAEETLWAMGTDPPKPKSHQVVQAPSRQVEIVLVPMGKINLRLLEEVRDELQAKTGLVYPIDQPSLVLGKPDQTSADRFLKELSDSLKKLIPEKRMNEFLEEQKLKLEDLETLEGMLTLTERVGDTAPKIYQELKQLGNGLWFDAVPLTRQLERTYPMGRRAQARGYLGIMEAGLLSEEDGALRAYSFQGQGYGVMTYRSLLSSFAGEAQNRPRLRSRFVKETLYYAFKVLGISECVTPACARANSASTADIDQKGEELCPLCRELLSDYLEKLKPNSYSPTRVVREAQRLMGEGRYQEAGEVSERARQLDPEDVEANLLQARLYDDFQHFEEALALHRTLLERHSDDPHVLAEFLWFCADHTWWPYGEDEAAVAREGLRKGEEALSKWSEEPEFLEAYGWLAYQAEKPELASRLLEWAVAYQKTPQRLYAWSIVLSTLGKKTQAIQTYQEARQLQEQQAESIFDRGFREKAEALLQGLS